MQSRNVYALLLFVLCSSFTVWSQTAAQLRDLSSVRPMDRILLPIANDRRAVLSGQRHPLATPGYSIGKAAPDLYMQRMVLVLAADPAQDAALEELLRAQHDSESPYYHQWLTPAQFGMRFGISQNDLSQVTKWLQTNGMEIEEVPVSHRMIVFSGTAAQVESAFHTSIQKYLVKGALHYANANDPEIPRALAAVVRGVVSLHDFRSAPTHVVSPNYTAANGAHFLMPQDWVTIYDVGPLYNQGLDGTGQSIAVLGRVDVALQDVRTFRTNAGLPPNDPQMIINGPDPGFPWCDDELESAMDVEWAGAIANNASIKFVTTQSGATDGINLSAQYAVNHNVAPIVSLSYGLCEAALGSGGNAFWNSTWAQAAAQGMSVFVSSGDGDAAGCDSPALTTATQGRGVNGLCSTPYSSCVGGTQFNDGYNPGQYWSATNGPGQSSALGYIPELAWNESGWSGGLWAGGGGASIVYGKPGWQTAPGVPADGKRDVPDVALHGSIQDAYVVQVQGRIFYASGTSAAAPSLASVMALVNAHKGAAQGNANPVFYALANQQLTGSGAAVFHDITSGNNSVPGVTGFNAGTGYDEATGLGSVDASLLVNHWSDGSASNFTLTPNVSSVSMGPGGSGAATVTMTGQGGFASRVTLASSGAPAGITVRFSSSTLTAAAPVTVTFTAAANAVAGASTVTITGTGGGLTRTARTHEDRSHLSDRGDAQLHTDHKRHKHDGGYRKRDVDCGFRRSAERVQVGDCIVLNWIAEGSHADLRARKHRFTRQRQQRADAERGFQCGCRRLYADLERHGRRNHKDSDAQLDGDSPELHADHKLSQRDADVGLFHRHRPEHERNQRIQIADCAFGERVAERRYREVCSRQHRITGPGKQHAYVSGGGREGVRGLSTHGDRLGRRRDQNANAKPDDRRSKLHADSGQHEGD
jgi:pseudomonalisin